MRSAACDPLPRFCARCGLCPTALPLGPALPSSNSAGLEGPLFAAFSGTMAESDFFQSFIIGLRNNSFPLRPLYDKGRLKDLPGPGGLLRRVPWFLDPVEPLLTSPKRFKGCCLQLTGRPRHSRSLAFRGSIARPTPAAHQRFACRLTATDAWFAGKVVG